MKYSFLLILLIAVPLQAQNISVKDAWLRNSEKGFGTALFFTIDNNGKEADTLYSVSSDISDEIEIHESYSKGKDMMGMRPVEFVVINPDSQVQFKPRSFHVMILELNKDAAVGDSLEFILHFRRTGEVKTTAVVKKMGMMKK